MKKLLVLLANGFEIYEASVFIDVLGWNLVDGDGTTKAVICGFQKEITSTFGVKLLADITIDEVNVDDYEAVAIPGGFAEYDFYKEAYHEQFLELIRKFHGKNKTVASICVGALPVGKSGILTGKRGTTYNRGTGIRQKTLREYGVEVMDIPIVEDSNIITSWNPSTAMNVAFQVLERMTSKTQADKIRHLMGFIA